MEIDDQQIREQLSIKRQFLFLLAFSAAGLVCGWPFSAPSVFSILQYRTTWVVFTAFMLVAVIAADGRLWMLRNPGKTTPEYYRRKHWWFYAFMDWELDWLFGWLNKKGKREDQS
ncbi:hypothetical protein Xkhy_14425 [Xanthomonas axonopodis pv. khayae]|uniref:hypothetical protein n=1 Tax=Xanthomonas axonopodis TaxID=53413 RepID=UPI0009979F60|nr:hypothetical protein [Xanthomonas axonopodis]OOX14306.1 hypothetical protein Xkhy_14425 [Xanthomonas axonopodis pv. khayae]